MSRLVIDISPEQHRQIKAMAALSGHTIKDFVMQKLFTADSEDSAFEELKNLLLARIKETKESEPSMKSITDIGKQALSDEQ